MAHEREPVVGVLLAGGMARRMGGGDKCLLSLCGKTLLDHAIERIRPQVSAVVVNANGDPARFSSVGLPVVADSVEGHAGPLAGVLSGMLWTRQNHPQCRWIVSVATDTPFFPGDLVSRFLVEAGDSYPVIVLASSGERVHPVFGLWPTALAEDLDRALRDGVRKVLDWTGQHEQRSVLFDSLEIGGQSIDPFFNTNKPEELLEAEKIMEKCQA